MLIQSEVTQLLWRLLDNNIKFLYSTMFKLLKFKLSSFTCRKLSKLSKALFSNTLSRHGCRRLCGPPGMSAMLRVICFTARRYA